MQTLERTGGREVRGRRAAALAVALGLALACGPTNPVQGDWELDRSETTPGAVAAVQVTDLAKLRFDRDGATAGDTAIPGTWVVEEGVVRLVRADGRGEHRIVAPVRRLDRGRAADRRDGGLPARRRRLSDRARAGIRSAGAAHGALLRRYPMEATDTSNLRILGAYSARMAAGDYDAVFDTFAPDFRSHVTGRVTPGRGRRGHPPARAHVLGGCAQRRSPT